MRRYFGTLLGGKSTYREVFDYKSIFRKSILKSELGKINLKSSNSKLQFTLQI